MIQLLIAKNLIPFLIGVITTTATIMGIQHMTKQSINVSCPPPEVHVSCPPPKIEGNGIDVEKLKAYKGRITINQNYMIEAKGDSLMLIKISQAVSDELKRLKIARCK